MCVLIISATSDWNIFTRVRRIAKSDH